MSNKKGRNRGKRPSAKGKKVLMLKKEKERSINNNGEWRAGQSGSIQYALENKAQGTK